MSDRWIVTAIHAVGIVMATSGVLAAATGVGTTVFYTSAAAVVLLGLARSQVSPLRRPRPRADDSSRRRGRSSRGSQPDGR